MKRATLLTASLFACTPTPHAQPPMDSSSPHPDAPRCVTADQVRARVGQVCTVVGTYALEDVRNQKGEVFRRWPVVVLDADHAKVALESVWDASKMPDDATLARWLGRSVEVTGLLHLSPPDAQRRTNMSLLTISPVDAIRLVP